MTTHELKEQLESMTKIADIASKAIERIKSEIKDSERNDDSTILIAGMRFARLNLGATIDKPNGELYDFDTAQEAAPEGWSVPSKGQWKQLYRNTTSKWVNRDGVNGRLFTDKKSGNELFLPAVGYRSCNGTQYPQSDGGYYWASTTYNSDGGYNCYFHNDSIYPEYISFRSNGFSVRCVQELAA